MLTRSSPGDVGEGRGVKVGDGMGVDVGSEMVGSGDGVGVGSIGKAKQATVKRRIRGIKNILFRIRLLWHKVGSGPLGGLL
jgi:hypothetical protein